LLAEEVGRGRKRNKMLSDDDGPSPSTLLQSSSTVRFRDKIVVVTGGGSGIGKSLAYAFAREGARLVIVDLKDSHNVARDLNSLREDDDNDSTSFHHLAFTCDVTNPRQIRNMIQQVKTKYGKIDIYCSNAGIILPPRDTDTINNSGNNNYHANGSNDDDSIVRHSDSQWTKILQINLQSHIIAFRELLPDWEEDKEGVGKKKGDGIMVLTASAAGLLTQIGDASYGVSKAAVVSLAEHMAITHGSTVQVHCLAPQAVDTPFVDQLLKGETNSNSAMTDGIISPDVVAECTLQAIKGGSFWIFPHRRVQEYVHRKATDHARWLRGMQKLRINLKKNEQQHIVSKL
jgi:NAD(P)-dependent dehydrogenase (short-subunit alcohol dehydrogenase family)